METFIGYMRRFLADHNAKQVVEVGPDPQLILASRLAPFVETYYCCDFPSREPYVRQWIENHEDFGSISNIRALYGNGLELGKLLQESGINGSIDVIILHCVSPELEEGDTALLVSYMRGEEDLTQADWERLENKFISAQEKGLAEFLKVAEHGHIVYFGSQGLYERLNPTITHAGLNPLQITQMQLIYSDPDAGPSHDDPAEPWDMLMIDNTKK